MNLINIDEEQGYSSLKYSILFIALAYSFSVLVRLIWVYQFQGNEAFYWNDQLMINTNDGYYFAAALEHILYGTHTSNPQIIRAVEVFPGIIYASALFVKILPISLESVILYMPAFIASLVVIPIILTARLFTMQIFGLFSALIGSIVWSYYNRTMIGYYDSDMFAVLLQMFVLYGFISTLVHHKLSSIAFLVLTISVYPFFYPQGLSLIYAMYFIFIVYSLFEHLDKELSFISIGLIAISLTPIGLVFKLSALAIILLIHQYKKLALNYWIGFSILAFIFFLIYADVFVLIESKLFGYINRGTDEVGLHFYQVIQTVREAGQIPFSVMANRISGSILGVLISLLGYIFLVMRHKQFIVALPLLGIGIFSLWGGLRFTVYAVPVAAMSGVFLFYVMSSFFKGNLAKYTLISIGVIGLLYPNIIHIVDYKVPTVFNNKEIEVLDNLKAKGSDKDYVIAWWDYGYPLWFYSQKNTLIDGGKHHHDNYLVSKILTSSSQKEAAILSRLSVETYVSSEYKNVADTLFNNKQENQRNVENFFDELHADILTIPKATRDVYLYLPYRMLDILPTVKVFSNIDLDTGDKITEPFFYKATDVMQDEEKVRFGSGVFFDQKTGLLNIGDQQVPVNKVVTTGHFPNGKIRVNTQSIHPKAPFVILILQDYGSVLILDQEMFNSTYIQMFFLEKYDKNYFEPVELSPYAKVYKVKV